MSADAHKLIPSDPDKVTVIQRVTPEIITFSTPFLRFGRVKIGGRGTIVRLATGNTAIFSPTALTTNVRKEIDALGPVKYIVAPDQEHHIFLEEWHKAFPQAKIIGPESLPEYRKKQKYFAIPDACYTSTIKDKKVTVDPEFDGEFDMEFVSAHVNKEIVVNHRPTRTLIEADLIFNLPATEQFSKAGVSPTAGLLTRLFVNVNNTKSPIWQQRFIWYLASAEDRPAFNRSVSVIDRWDFDRIIPCHGDIIQTGGKDVFRRVMQWHLAAAKKQT